MIGTFFLNSTSDNEGNRKLCKDQQQENMGIQHTPSIVSPTRNIKAIKILKHLPPFFLCNSQLIRH